MKQATFATMHMFRALVMVLSALALSACKAPEPQQVTFLDGQFSITRPASWSIQKDLNDAADVQMADLRREGYTLVLSEAKVDFESDMSLEEFSETTRTGVLESLTNSTIDEGEKLILNGYPAIRYGISGSVDKIKIRYWHVVIDSGNHFHQLLIWSLPSQFDKNKEDFELVMNSLKAQ